MVGSTLTGDFWANYILLQLGIFAYNLSVMIRRKKSKFKRHRNKYKGK
jgi:hypothetical protein